MPQDGLFFRILRRFNLLLGALLGVALLAGAAYSGWIAYKIDSEFPFSSTPLAPATSVTYDVQLAPLETTDAGSNNNALYVLNREVPSPRGSFAALPEITNLMLIDPQTGSGKWLFKGTGRNILNRFGVREGKFDPDVATDKRRIVGLVLWVVEKDTDKDGTLTAADEASVYYWRLDKPEAVKLVEGVMGVAVGQIGPGFNVVYKKGGKTISVMYSIPDFKVISETTLSEP